MADVLDETGTNTFAHFEYDPFGSLVRSQVSAISPEIRWRFSSQWYEPFWNHYRYVYRVYSPELRRWLSADPLGDIASPATMALHDEFAGRMAAVAAVMLDIAGNENLDASTRFAAALGAAYWIEGLRALQSGSLSMLGESDWYVFCANNPVNFVDPLGLVDLWKIGKNAIGLVANTAGAVGAGILASTGFGTIPGAIAGTYCAYGAGANLGNIVNEIVGNSEGPTGPASLVARVGMLSAGVNPSSPAYTRIDYGAQALDLAVPLVASLRMPKFENLPPVRAGRVGTILGAVSRYLKDPETASVFVKGAVYTDAALTAVDAAKAAYEESKCSEK